MSSVISQCVQTPLGPVSLQERDGKIIGVSWRDETTGTSALLREAIAQVTAYFSNDLQRFDLPLEVEGSAAQKRACDAIDQIPFGDTKTYGELAKALGVSAQAMGQLCGGNPIPIIIPCHRVLGAKGLGGFSGGTGVEDKVWLLRHEGAAGLLI